MQVSKIKSSEKKGERYMQVWDERAYWKEEGLEEGLKEGLKAVIETCKELGLSQEETYSKVIEKFTFTEEDVREYLEDYWQDS